MFVRFALVLGALALAVLATSVSPADARHRCADGACNLPPSKIVKSSSWVGHKRVVYHTRVIPRTRVVNHNRLILHRHTVKHDHLTVHKLRTVHKLTVLHRYNTLHRRQILQRHYYRQAYVYARPVYLVRHRAVMGYNRWCGCGY